MNTLLVVLFFTLVSVAWKAYRVDAQPPSELPSRAGPTIWDNVDKKKGFQWVDKNPPIYGIKTFENGLCDDKVPVKSVVESTEKPGIIKKMEGLSYDVNTENGNVNVIGERKTNPVGVCEGSTSSKCWKSVFTNEFQDVLHIVWKCDGKWRHYQTDFTTLPGWYIDKKGTSTTSVMAPGQYKNSYCVGDHKGTPALRQSAIVKQWLLQRRGTKGTATVTYKLTSRTPMSKTRNLNFHGTINGRGKPKQNKGKFPYTRKVNSWSLGCQVTFGSIFRDEVLAIIGTSLNDEELKALHGVNRKTTTCDRNRADCNKCTTYTLMNGFDTAEDTGNEETDAKEEADVEDAKDDEKSGDDVSRDLSSECPTSSNPGIAKAIARLCQTKPEYCSGAKTRKANFFDWVYCLYSFPRKKSSMEILKASANRFPKPCLIQRTDRSYDFLTEVKRWKSVKNDAAAVCVANNGYSAPKSDGLLRNNKDG